MVARTYNFTKQNGVVMKAKRRFTKQNGVVKQILNGWTKTNGVVEKVYNLVPVREFSMIVPLESGSQHYPCYVNANYVVKEHPDSSSTLCVQENYLAFGNVTPITFGVAGSYSYYGYNYAESSIINLRRDRYHELLTSDLYNPTTYFSYGSSLFMPTKISTGQYVGIASPGNNTTSLVYVSDTGTVTGQSIPYATNFSTGLNLYNGRAICVVRQVSTTSTTNDTKTFVVYDYDDNDPDKMSYTTVETYMGGIGLTGSMMGRVYSPNGQDCFFCVNWDAYGHEETLLCKYNIQTKTVTKTTLGYSRIVIGTYNGYVYALTQSSQADEWFVVEKYDLSLSRVGTHVVPLPTGITKWSGYAGISTSIPTIHSNGRYCAIKISDSEYNNYMLYLDLGLF